MKLISSNKDQTTVEFTKEEFDVLLRMAFSVREEYTSLDPGLLDLEKEQVEKFDDALHDDVLSVVFSDKKHME